MATRTNPKLAQFLAARVRRYCRELRAAGERVTLRAVVGDVVEPAADLVDLREWDGRPGWIPTRDGAAVVLYRREPWAEVMVEE